MGDEGKLYSIYTVKMQEQMLTLIRKADIIAPNYTEACFLLGEPYQSDHSDIDEMKKWLIRLASLGPSIVVMTGIHVNKEKIVNIGYDRNEGAYWQVSNDYIPVQYPGTGDVFASVLAGCLIKGESLMIAMTQAAEFVSRAIKATFAAGTNPREGVLLETVLPWLCVKS